MALAADTLLVSLAAGAERRGRRQSAVDTATAYTALATTARLASADAAWLCVQFYKNTEPWLYILLFTKTLLHSSRQLIRSGAVHDMLVRCDSDTC